MKVKKILALVLALATICTLAACGKKPAGDETEMTAQEAAAEYKSLMEAENAIFAENTALWEKLFMTVDKAAAENSQSDNYGEFLLKAIEAAKDSFTEEELKTLTAGAQKMQELEDKMAALEKKFPQLNEDPSMSGGMSVPEGELPSDAVVPGGSTGGAGNTDAKPAESSGPKFPAFTGKDLDGNAVDSKTLFSGNAVTVVNFWFTTCSPCVGELADLDALNQELAKKGGALIGVNAFTLGGDETAIAEAKSVLTKKGAGYQNVYFDGNSTAGKFVEDIFAYPTTYVVDRNGNIMGDPIVGAITEKAQAAALQAQIDAALAADKG